MFHTKKWLLVVSFVTILIIVCVLLWSFQKTDTVSSATVFVDRNGFEPSNLVIRRGQSVEFINRESISCAISDSLCHRWPASDPYPTHELYPEFDPRGPIAPGQSWVFRFDRLGNWGFHDHFKPASRGVVRVIE